MKKKYPLCEYLPKNIVNEMHESIDQTEKTKREHGFNICSSASIMPAMNEKNTISINKCIGEACSIKGLYEQCPEKTIKVSTFHTHPNRVSYPSLEDVKFARDNEYGSICIGIRKENNKNTNERNNKTNNENNKNTNEIRCMSSDIPLGIYYLPKSYTELVKTLKEKVYDCTITQ